MDHLSALHRDQETESLFVRYYAGQCTEAELVRVEALLASHEAERRVVDALRRGEDLSTMDADVVRASLDRVLGRVHEAVSDGISRRERDGRAMRPRDVPHARTITRRWWIGGIVTVASLVAILGTRLLRNARTAPVAATSPTEYVTANGQRATVHLSDGSTVVLNAATRLRVSSGSDVSDAASNANTQILELDGEALFTVAPNHTHPFIVHAAGVTTTVLGTEFGIRAYASDSSVRVAVRTGRVQVGRVALAARDMAFVQSNGETKIARGGNVSDALAFASGLLVLRDVTLRDALPDLMRWYDADIQLADSAIAAKRIDGTFAVGSRRDLVTLLGPLFHTRVTVAGRTVSIASE